MTKEELIKRFNALDIPDMEKVTDLYQLKGSFINLNLPLPNGNIVKFWDDEKTYYGNEICKHNSSRCYGLAADDQYLLVVEYGEGGKDTEIVIFLKLL